MSDLNNNASLRIQSMASVDDECFETRQARLIVAPSSSRKRNRAATAAERAVRLSSSGGYVEQSEREMLIFRNRLYDLFGSIEKEFESLYAENCALQIKVEALTGRLAEIGTSLPPERAAELLEVDAGGAAKAPKKGSQVGQKIKTAFRVPPGRLVSSFKAGVGGGDASRVRFVRSFVGHRDGVWDVHVSHSTRQVLASASADQTAHLWCPETGACLAQYIGHTGSVNSIRFCPISTSAADLLVLTASGDQSAHIWRASVALPSAAASTIANASSVGQVAPTTSSEDEIDPTLFDRDDAVVDDAGEHYTTIKKPALELTGHSGVVIAADWICGASQVITASWDRTANVYDAERGEILHVLNGHDQELTHTSAHWSQRLAVTSSKDATFRLWDFREAIHSVAVFQGHSESVTSAVFSSSDKVVSGSDDRTVKVWDLKNMRTALATIRLDSPVNRLAISPGSQTIAIPHDNRHIRLYDLQGNRLARLPRSNGRSHRRMVCSVAWSNDANAFCNLFSCGFDKTILGWKVNFPLNKD